MDDSQRGDDRRHDVITNSVRDAIARALDGAVPDSDTQAVNAYRAAMTPVSTSLPRQLKCLRALGAAGLVSAPSSFNVSLLLDAVGVSVTPTCAIPSVDRWPGIIVIGCLSNLDAGRDRWLAGMLRRGAIVVSSDKSAALPSIGRHLAARPGQPGKRARFAAGASLIDGLDVGTAWFRYVTEMHPPVRLSPGHLPLERDQPIGVDVVARDAMTGEPLVVRALAHSGQVIHAVPHWWQETEPDATELGRRSLASIAAFADSDIANCDSTVGWFGAASVMLTSLLTALDHALPEIDIPRLPDSFSSLFDLD